MDIKERVKKVGKLVLTGAIWVYVLSIPVGEDLLFDKIYDVLVDNSVVHAIQREAKTTWRGVKVQARSALADTESDIPSKAKNVEKEF